MRARRALLYTPGDDLHKIQKAVTLDADCICMDIEDGVALNRKPQARQVILQALAELDFGRSERLVRLNALGSGLEADDLNALFGGQTAIRPDGIVVPKVGSADQVRWISAQLAVAEARFGWQPGALALIIQVETAAGLVNLREICSADPRLQAVIFGAEDLVNDIGATRSAAGWEVFYARGAVVAHAAAYGLQAIDMVYVNFRDPEGLSAEALQGAQLGFTGKQVIHPSQVAPVQQAFTPSPEAAAHAQRVIDAFETHQAQGRGAFELDGKMVDAPVVKAAQRVLERAQVVKGV
ncbi:MAG TPA: CoA ester lyase [Anaerolineales bacterium]|nr:CoA ester lyase [Anaerolineales bacterium]